MQLRHAPPRETRNRKLLRPNPLAAWELRVGPVRIFYEVDAEEADVVNVLAIGTKTGNRLFIAGQEIYSEEFDGRRRKRVIIKVLGE